MPGAGEFGMTLWRRISLGERTSVIVLTGAALWLLLNTLVPQKADPEAIGEWDGPMLLVLFALLVLIFVQLPAVLISLTRRGRVHEQGWRDLLDRLLPLAAWLALAGYVLF